MALTNYLTVINTTSDPGKQTCQVDVDSPIKIFSYKCCDAEDDKVEKGKDYAFTLTYGNMGECEGTTRVTDCLSVTDVGGIQFKLEDACEPCKGHTVYVGGCFYYPARDLYFCSYPFVYSIEIIELFNLEPVVCPGNDICFYVFDNLSRDLTLAPHTVNTFGVILQAEDIFCTDCPCEMCIAGINTEEPIRAFNLDKTLPPTEQVNVFNRSLNL